MGVNGYFFLEKPRKKQSLSSHLYGIQEGVKKRLQAVPMPGEMSLPKKDQDLLQKSRLETARLNVNNVVRTKTYLDFYRLYPEIRWAFLAHMVSRNGRCFFFFRTEQLAYFSRCLSAIFSVYGE